MYAPNRNPVRNSFLEFVSDSIDLHVAVLLAGDFNTVFDRSLDRRGSLVGDTSRESTVGLSHLFDSTCCVDIWRYLHPSASGFSWCQPDGLVSSRIDLIGCPYSWVASVCACDLIPCPFSHHCALVFSCNVPSVVPPAPGLWKLNYAVLSEAEYVSAVHDLWCDWRKCKNGFPSLAKWWEAGKSRIKGVCISYCTKRSRVASMSRDLLVRLVSHLKERLDNGLLSCLDPYMSALSQLSNSMSNLLREPKSTLVLVGYLLLFW